MIVIKKVSGEVSEYKADEVKTTPTEYFVILAGKIIGQIPRERVEEIVFIHPETVNPE